MGFPSVWGGVLPLVVINTAISIALVRNMVDAILRMVGFFKRERLPDPWHRQPQIEPPSDRIPTFIEQVQSTLPLVEFNPSTVATSSDHEVQEQCAVCLCDFDEGQLVRQLPHCSHIFHGDCLDKWLQHNHMTCPMCRSSLLTEELALKHKQDEEIVAEELAMWLSVYHSSGLGRGPWWYHTAGVHGSFAPWEFH